MRHTNSFYIQSPRLQTAFPVSPSENLVARVRAFVSELPAHVDFNIMFGPDSGVKVSEGLGALRYLGSLLWDRLLPEQPRVYGLGSMRGAGWL